MYVAKQSQSKLYHHLFKALSGKLHTTVYFQVICAYGKQHSNQQASKSAAQNFLGFRDNMGF
jgi:hypothetical protein